ncbi:unnamed protein product [Psylliodes chrysocephalus]|uniref:Uncharacterized protein n=1 Tax=Psylliodes chrysocephalus TaxID=3402493 RepID=A0A9P0GID8_9CUCU|nr:unnamed protein product [Psylliodes chrysocephala]
MNQVKIISHFCSIGGGQFQIVKENPDLDNSVIYISGNCQPIGSIRNKKMCTVTSTHKKMCAVTSTPLLNDRFEKISTDEIFGDSSMVETPTTSMLSPFDTRTEDLGPFTSMPSGTRAKNPKPSISMPSETTAEDLGPSTFMPSGTTAEDLEPSTFMPSGTTAEYLGPSTSMPSGTRAKNPKPSTSMPSETTAEDLGPSTSMPSGTTAEDPKPSTELVSPPENVGSVIRSASDLSVFDEDDEICNYQRQLSAFLEINNQFCDQTLKLQNNLKKKLFKYETKVSRIKKRINKLAKYGDMAINLKTLYKNINK